MPVRSAWLINRTDTTTGQSRADTRLAPTGTMAPNGVLTSRDGVIPGSPEGRYVMGGLYVFGDAAGMTATVAPGRAVVQSIETAGAYPVVLTDYATVTFADGDASNPRIDLVVLRIYDALYDSSGRTEAVLEAVQGVPAANPEVPRTPSGSIALAEVTVPAGASQGTGGIDWATGVADRRRPTVAVGGIVPQSWGDNCNGSYVGQYRDAAGRLERWDGTVWRPVAPGPAFAYHTDGGYCSTLAWSETATDTNGPTVTAAFVAPPGGTVVVTVGFHGAGGSSSSYAALSARIRQGGTLVLEADNTRAAFRGGTVRSSSSSQFQVRGLTPGTEYTATLAYRSTKDGESAWFDNRFVRVDPMG